MSHGGRDDCDEEYCSYSSVCISTDSILVSHTTPATSLVPRPSNRWLLKSGTERNGMERFRLLKYGTHGTEQSRNSHGTVSFASFNGTDHGIDHGLLPVNDERIFRFANGWGVLYTLLEKFLVCVRKLAFMDQEHCRGDTH